MDIFAVVMAGGVGTRFWPLSRKTKPKQFLPIISDKTMIEETVHRLLPEIPLTHIFTIADLEQTQAIKALLPDLPEKNFFVEPQGRNTAPSLILASASLFLRDPKSVVVALPADHLITDSSLFLKKLKAGATMATQGDYLITFGIPPTSPATGYGYIQFLRPNSFKILGEDFFTVQNFKEKPSYAKAKEFIDAGNFFWNSGMFIWQAETFARKLKQYSPSLYRFWKKILEALRNKDKDLITSIFEEMPSISIDYALMENAKGVLMCEGNFGWSDVGAWSSLTEIWLKDKNGNALRGENIVLDSKNCFLFSPQKLTALIGLKDIIVVDTDDALLICHKDQDQKVKDIVERIMKKGKDKYL